MCDLEFLVCGQEQNICSCQSHKILNKNILFDFFPPLFWLKESFPDKKQHCFSPSITGGFVSEEQWIDICLWKASVKVGQEEISPMICCLAMPIDFSLLAGEVYLALPAQNWEVIWDGLCSQELQIKDSTGAMAKEGSSEGAVWALDKLQPILPPPFASREAWAGRGYGLRGRLIRLWFYNCSAEKPQEQWRRLSLKRVRFFFFFGGWTLVPKAELGFLSAVFAQMPNTSTRGLTNWHLLQIAQRSTKIRKALAEHRGLTSWLRLWEIRQDVISSEIQKCSGWSEPQWF